MALNSKHGKMQACDVDNVLSDTENKGSSKGLKNQTNKRKFFEMQEWKQVSKRHQGEM
jgi:hypothetical protein